MGALKRKLLSLFLACFSSLNSFAQEKTESPPVSQEPGIREEKKYYPQTLEEYFDIFDTKLEETGERNKRLFRGLETERVLSRYIYRTPDGYKLMNDSFYPTEKEKDIVKEYTIDFLEHAGKEFKYSLGWIDDLEEEIKYSVKEFFDNTLEERNGDSPLMYSVVDSINSLFRYGFSFKGKEADGHTHSPTLNEERRLENRERRERTGMEFVIPEFGRRYIFDMSFGYSVHGWDLKGLFGGLETEISLKDFQLLGHNFNEAELNFCADQEAKFSLTKLLGNNWYYELSSRFETFPEFDTVSLSFVRETNLEKSISGVVETLPSKLVFSVYYQDVDFNRYRGQFSYILRF